MRRTIVIALAATMAAVGIGVGGRAVLQVDPLTAAASASASPPPSSAPATALAAGPTTTAAPLVIPHEIVFLGDSITDQARAEIRSDLAAAPDDIRAVGGLRIEDMQYAATALTSRRPEQVVINLGTNNVLQADDTDHAVAALATMIAVFPNARCIHLATINEAMLAPPKDVHGGAVRFNERLRRLAAADPRIRLIDWAKVVADHDHRGDPSWPITTDNVHPTPSGQALMLDAYRQSIETC